VCGQWPRPRALLICPNSPAELFAILAQLNIGTQQLLARQPELATEISMTTDVLTREFKGLIRRARTVRECINAARTIAKVLRETADEFEVI
jgi:hypothetical protein